MPESGNYIKINFNINEGRRYKLKKIELYGNKFFSDAEILKVLNVGNKQYYNPVGIRKRLTSLKRKYLNIGKLDIGIMDEINILENYVTARINISEGSTYYIKNINDSKLEEFNNSLHAVLLNLSKRIAADGEGASKFITINVNNSKNQEEAKKIAFSIANSPLVKTAIAGEDPNWGRIIMAIGKANVNINLNKLEIKFGTIKIIEKGQLSINYNEIEVAEYMKNEIIDLSIDLNMGKKNFSAYTMDLTKKYIEINSDYRS